MSTPWDTIGNSTKPSGSNPRRTRRRAREYPSASARVREPVPAAAPDSLMSMWPIQTAPSQSGSCGLVSAGFNTSVGPFGTAR